MPELRAQPQRREATRAQVLAFMAGLAHAAKNRQVAEGFLLELLAHVTFSDEVNQR